MGNAGEHFKCACLKDVFCIHLGGGAAMSFCLTHFLSPD